MIEIRLGNVNVLSAPDGDGGIEAIVFQDPKSGVMVRVELAGEDGERTRRAALSALQGEPPPAVPTGTLKIARTLPNGSHPPV